jgi:hypothetical protein
MVHFVDHVPVHHGSIVYRDSVRAKQGVQAFTIWFSHKGNSDLDLCGITGNEGIYEAWLLLPRLLRYRGVRAHE